MIDNYFENILKSCRNFFFKKFTNYNFLIFFLYENRIKLFLTLINRNLNFQIRLFVKIILLLVIFQVIFISKIYAQQEARSDREALISSQGKKFFQSNRSRQYLSFGGSYGSDYNSKSYQIYSRYVLQNENFTHELNALHQVDYADTGSGKTKKYQVKKSELYDLMLSSKARIFRSNNYGVFYHRSIYDKFSNFFYDQRTALGLGRMFLNQKLELDFSLAYRDVKVRSYEVNYLSSLRLNHKFNNKFSLMQRSYIFFGNDLLDQEHRTSLVYRLNNQASIEIRHSFEKRRYVDLAKKNSVNQIARGISFGVIFDLY